jgi:hypothetical protein
MHWWPRGTIGVLTWTTGAHATEIAEGLSTVQVRLWRHLSGGPAEARISDTLCARRAVGRAPFVSGTRGFATTPARFVRT